jgi:hypothetical protein
MFADRRIARASQAHHLAEVARQVRRSARDAASPSIGAEEPLQLSGLLLPQHDKNWQAVPAARTVADALQDRQITVLAPLPAAP